MVPISRGVMNSQYNVLYILVAPCSYFAGSNSVQYKYYFRQPQCQQCTDFLLNHPISMEGNIIIIFTLQRSAVEARAARVSSSFQLAISNHSLTALFAFQYKEPFFIYFVLTM
jgi:hypothetical protein